MTYNINAGRYHVDGLEAVAKVIEAARPDLVGLQEVDRHAQRTGTVAQADWLAAKLNMYAVFVPALDYPDGGEYGVALLTKYPVIAQQSLELPHFASEELRQRMPAGIRHHADEPRAALIVTIDASGRTLNAIVTHFGLTADQRLAQAEEILGFTRPWISGGVATVLLGDLNARPDSPVLKALTQELVDACAGSPAGVRATRRPSVFDPVGLIEVARHIDYILTSRDIAIQASDIIRDESEASDHHPVIADLWIA